MRGDRHGTLENDINYNDYAKLEQKEWSLVKMFRIIFDACLLLLLLGFQLSNFRDEEWGA